MTKESPLEKKIKREETLEEAWQRVLQPHYDVITRSEQIIAADLAVTVNCRTYNRPNPELLS